MILGHITFTYVVGDILKRKNFQIHLPALILGAMIPDLIDKPVAFFFAYPGRGCAHSVIVLTLLFFLLLRCIKQERWACLVRTVFAGSLLHLAQDFASPEVLLWPFLHSWDSSPSLTFFEKIEVFYVERSMPIQWWLEILSVVYILASFFRKPVVPAPKEIYSVSKKTRRAPLRT